MPVCPICGSNILAWSNFCPNCGSKLTQNNDDIPANGLLENRYRIIKTLYRDNLGRVYFAIDLGLNNGPRAIREFINVKDQKYLAILKEDAIKLLQLRHPFLPRIIDFFWREDERWYLVMEHIEGETLKSHVEKEGPLPEYQVKNLARQLCSVLEYLHKQGLYYSLNPTNIILTKDGTLKLNNFNSTLSFSPQPSDESLTLGSTGFGTPDQKNSNHKDIKSDIYMLGATLHYLITGEPPNLASIDPPLKTDAVSKPLQTFIKKALELNHENRPNTLNDLLYLLGNDTVQPTVGFPNKPIYTQNPNNNTVFSQPSIPIKMEAKPKVIEKRNNSKQNNSLGSVISKGFSMIGNLFKKEVPPVKETKKTIMGTQIPIPARIPQTDQVHFTVTGPPVMSPGSSHVLKVWAHLAELQTEVLNLARKEFGSSEVSSQTSGGERISRETKITIRLKFPDFRVLDEENTITWLGETTAATFPVSVPKELLLGLYIGTLTFYVDGLLISKLHFRLKVDNEDAPPVNIPIHENRIKSAFASYASQDRDEVLARIQGIKKVFPNLDLFLDVVSLRAGELWENRIFDEVSKRDIFYLFWSSAASKSEWVEKEWRLALQVKGHEFIDPVPLVSPEVVPPPKELAEKLHFNDWTLAFMRTKKEN